MVASFVVEVVVVVGGFCWGGGAGAMRGLEGAGFDVAWGAIGWDCSMLQVVAFCVWWLSLVVGPCTRTPSVVGDFGFCESGQLVVQN